MGALLATKRAQLLEIDPEFPEPRRIQRAAEVIRRQQVLVYPTDTIYGLGAELHSRPGLEKLYALRQLERKKPLSIVCPDLSQASQYAQIHNEAHRTMRALLPGPYTFVLAATRDVPRMGDKKRHTVGIRIPGHPVALALLEALGGPILSTSALLDDDGPSVSDPRALAQQYSAGVGLVLDAGILPGEPSTVIDWTEDEPRVLRHGAGDVSRFE